MTPGGLKARIRSWLLAGEPEGSKEDPIQEFIRRGVVTVGRGTYHMPVIVEYPNDLGKVHIGSYCSIHWDVEIFRGGNHRMDWAAIYGFKALSGLPIEPGEVVLDTGDVNIGNDCWIGRTATILSGVTIGDGAVVGAKSVVTRDIGPYEIWAGNPAKFIRKRLPDPQIEAMLRIKWWEWPDEIIAGRTLDLNGLPVDDFIERYDPARQDPPGGPPPPESAKSR